MTGHAPAHRGTAEAKPRDWQGAWHLQNRAEGHGGPLLFGGGRDLRR